MNKLKDLNVKIFADGADLQAMIDMSRKDFIKGLTTNPTLMRKAGISDYQKFAREALSFISDKPISFEVFSDDIQEMERQAMEISSWGKNANVKIPITNSEGLDTSSVIKKLSHQGHIVNVTALCHLDQVRQVVDVLDNNTPAYISIFAGRIADTGVDPIPIMQEALLIMKEKPNAQLIWASPRELLNVFQANVIGCHVITATVDILKKLDLIGKDLKQYSLETVQMFRQDALSSGFTI